MKVEGRTHHIGNVEDFPGHGFLIVGWGWRKPQLLECLVYQFLSKKIA